MDTLNLFKYYAPKYNGEYNLSFYSQGSIYFQKPINFNDPWDCKAPQLIVPRQINLLKDIWFKLARQYGPANAKAEWHKIRKLPRAEIKKLFGKLFKEAFEKLRSKIGVFSLSFIPDSELMWSHYASSHSGYLLHFEINIAEYLTNTNLVNAGIPIPVVYKDKREVVNLGSYYANREKHAYNLIRFKSNVWEYECELRLLNVDRYGFVKIPRNWVKSIILGIDTDKQLKAKLSDIGKELNVPVLSAIMDKKEYKLNIPGLETDGDKGRSHYREVLKLKTFTL